MKEIYEPPGKAEVIFLDRPDGAFLTKEHSNPENLNSQSQPKLKNPSKYTATVLVGFADSHYFLILSY